jgi:ubiquinone/menaquinone biosynthesis C-methylase UbiE
MTSQPHSAAQFTPSRDHWWNEDFLYLMAQRLSLGACRDVLELGAGKGHWTALVLKHCAPAARITAIDREPRWITSLQKRFAGNRGVTALQADATNLKALKLPGKYDLITCQTLLMHLPDVPPVLHECYELLAPGGLLLVCEPNNFANRLDLSTSKAELSPAEMGQLTALWWAYEKGREALGLGQEWIAVRLPQMIYAAGFPSVAVYTSDRPSVLTPPYRADDQRAAITDWLAVAPTGDDVAAYEDTRRYVLAGGLSEEDFDRAWAVACELDARERADLAARKLASCSGGNLHLFAARKPARK